MSNRWWRALSFAALVGLVLLAITPNAQAQTPMKPQEEKTEEQKAEEEKKVVTEEITVTGTRVEGRTATETPAPVDVVDETAIDSAGATETGKILQLLAPSVNFSSTTISDGTDIIRPVTLRGLGPDQTLLLVNGKRRHQQALIHFQQTVGRGSAGYDINTIPASAIERIEVLRDAAAAQYGSDAIAGVINIILKGATGATDVALDAGAHYEGDGERFMAGVNSGWGTGPDRFLNFTVEFRDRGETNRAGVATTNLLGWYHQADFDRGVREVKLRIGDADSEDVSAWLNGALAAGPGELYAFGGWSGRKGNSSGFYRGPRDGRTVPALYPNGFLPTIVTEPSDMSLVAGYRGIFANDWKWDASVNWGKNEFKFREENTVNISYWYEPRNPSNPTGPKFEESPTEADTGTLESDQTAFNLDFAGKLDWGVGRGPVNVAFGAEWREEGYQITPGEPVSFQYGRTNNPSILILNQAGGAAAVGTQGFPGYADAIEGDRNNLGIYVDLESELSDRFLGGLALRFEDYSDFGTTLTGKLSGRFDFTEQYSARGTLSTGFRAPGVAQIFHVLRSTNLDASTGTLTDTLSTNQDHPLNRAFGIPPLKEETSMNYSVGLVAKIADNFRFTVDLYRIEIEDRIVFSSAVRPSVSPAVAALLAPARIGQIQFFTNAIDTETTGLDVVALYDWTISDRSLLGLEGAFHFNSTDVTDRRSTSAIVPDSLMFGDEQILLFEEGQPGEHYVISGNYYYDQWKANLRFNYFGEVAGAGFTGIKQTWSGKWLTDASITIPFRNNLSLSVGGLNIFDVYPDDWSQEASCLANASDGSCLASFADLGFTYGWETLPFGINGGYYYARLNYKMSH